MNLIAYVGFFALLVGFTHGAASDEAKVVKKLARGEAKLVKKLLREYDRAGGKLVRPVVNVTDTLVVQFGAALLRAALDDDNVLTTRIWLRYQWTDYHLQWDPAKFSGVDTIRLPADRIWLPDMKLYNEVETMDVDMSVLTVVSYDGSVLWIPPATAKVDCDSTYNCTFKFGSWTYDGFKMNVEPYGGVADLDVSDFFQRPSLKLVSHSGARHVKYYACCHEPYIDMTYNVVVKPLQR